MELYLELIPDELIYIIISFNPSDTSFMNISERIKKLYDGYISGVHDGIIFPFDIISLKFNAYFLCKNVRIDRFTSYCSLYSTSDYYKNQGYNHNEMTEYTSNIKNLKNLIYYESIATFNSYNVFYIGISTKDNIKNLYIMNKFKSLTLKNEKIEESLYESYNWGEIWNRLSLEIQNAILYQNDFPPKGQKIKIFI